MNINQNSQNSRYLFALLGGLILVVFYFTPAALSQGKSRLQQDVEKVFSDYDQLSLDAAGVAQAVRQTGQLALRTSEGTFDLALTPHDLRADNYRAQEMLDGGVVRELPRGPVHTYKGTVRGLKGSQARFSIDGEKIEGMVITPTEKYFIEPAAKYSSSAKPQDFIFYKQSDLKEDSFGECGTPLAQAVANESERVNTNPSVLSATQGGGTDFLFGPPLEVEIATEADFEYFTALGSVSNAVRNEITSILNMVDGIYNEQLGIRLRIVFQNVWTVPQDPYTTTEADEALIEFTEYWNNTPPRDAPRRDLTHLWTGKDLNGPTIGIAFSKVVCNNPLISYGLSQRIPGTLRKTLLTAHEIGHNFSARHSDAVAGCENSIMNSSLSDNTMRNFCQFSRDEITDHAFSNSGCLTRLTAPGCTYALSSTSQNFGPGGGSGSVTVTPSGGCNWAVAESVDWITVTAGASGTGSGSFNFTVAANDNCARAARLDIGGQIFTVTQAAGTNYVATPISAGQPISGVLQTGDCRPGRPARSNALSDQYSFFATAGQQVSIHMEAAIAPPEGLDTFLYLTGPDNSIVAENDDIVPGQQTNSRIPLSGLFTLPASGRYIIDATSFENNETGGYRLTLTGNITAPVNTIALSSGAYTVNEGVGAVTITVNRTGDTSAPATVDYATTDGTNASERSDYNLAAGTLRFAAGETSQTFPIFITDDRFVESVETVNLTLSNPTGSGATLGTRSTATLTITSDDAATGANPVKDPSFDAGFFVRQHYYDFLNREPDASGFAYWTNQITECESRPAAEQQECREVRRINVSAAFFVSIEFQQTGYFVYLFNQAAYGRRIQNTVPVTLREFLPDTQAIGRGVIVGQDGFAAVLERNKQAFAESFVRRSEFIARYPATLEPAAFVDALNANTEGSLSSAERDQLVNELTANNTTAGRASVLRKVAEDDDFENREFARAFVLMQYFGYLRRNPFDAPEPTLDFTGYNFWLDKLNTFGGNYVTSEMVKAFITSNEYATRFGP